MRLPTGVSGWCGMAGAGALMQTGIGRVPVRRVKLRDRGASEGERIRFTSALCRAGRDGRRAWMPCCRSLPALGSRWATSGGPGSPAGQDGAEPVAGGDRAAPGAWQADYARWQRRDLSARHYVYLWADGVYLQARMEPQAECMLVLIGATPEGKKELVGFQVGVRESAQSWRELLADLKARGLAIAPELATGDGRSASGRRSRRSSRDPAPAVLGAQDRQCLG
jgi:hypothetical protein